MKFVVYKDPANEWRWRFQAANGQIVAHSGESYRDKKDCLYGIELVKLSFGTPVETYRKVSSDRRAAMLCEDQYGNAR